MAETIAAANGIPNSTTMSMLEATTHIPIAQLTPLLPASASRSVKAVVTLTWPYSSRTGSVAFLLAEPDFRLRRIRGQVRVQFSGSSANAIAKSGITSGDEVILCLDGVEYVGTEAPSATPGRGVEFELKFTDKLLLQVRIKFNFHIPCSNFSSYSFALRIHKMSSLSASKTLIPKLIRQVRPRPRPRQRQI